MIGYSKDSVVKYTPAYAGNDSFPANHKLSVGINPVSNAESIELKKALREASKNFSKDDRALFQSEHDNYMEDTSRALFLKHVKWVKNYKMHQGNKIVKCTDVEKFYDTAFAGLITEINLAMNSYSSLSSGQAKNLEGDSKSDTPKKKVSPKSVKPAKKKIKKTVTA